MSQASMKINKINTDIVWEMIWKAWELGKFNYPLSLTLTFLFFVGMSMAAIPIVGAFVSGAVGALAPVVFFQACQSWEKGEKSEVSKVFKVFDDKERLQAMAPLIITSFLVGVASNLLPQIPVFATLATPLSLVSFPVSLVLGLANPVLFFNYKQVGMKKSVFLALQGIGKNLIPFIVGLILLAVVTVISLALLIIPFFLVMGPLLITYNYIWYRVIYEDLVLTVKDESII